MLKGFCCMRLSTAGVVIGWIGAAGSLVAAIVFSVLLADIDDIVKDIYARMNDSSISEASLHTGLLVMFCFYLTVNLINLVSSTLLVVGSMKERHLLLVPWLLNAGISLFMSGLYYVFVAVAVAGSALGQAVLTICVSSLILGFQFYIWYAVFSLFKLLQQRRDEEQRLLPSRESVVKSDYQTYHGAN